MLKYKQHIILAAAATGDCLNGFSGGKCGIADTIVLIINVLSAVAGVVIVIMIIIGGIQYTSARDNPQAVATAKAKIINALLALVVFIFGWSFLQWIVPGGILR